MRGLYAVYTEKARDEILGHIWLYQRELEQMRRYGHLRILVDEDLPLGVVPRDVPFYEEVSLQTITLWLDVTREKGERALRIYTDADKDKVAKARKAQESNFRFPVPISLLPA